MKEMNAWVAGLTGQVTGAWQCLARRGRGAEQEWFRVDWWTWPLDSRCGELGVKQCHLISPGWVYTGRLLPSDEKDTGPS